MAVLYIILLTLCFAASIQATVICSHCNQPITDGSWIKIDDKDFHSNHFLCARCGADLSKQAFYEEAGKYYDSTCYARMFMAACDYCGEPLVGKYMEDESGKYHISCYENHVALKCAICGGSISGQYYIDGRGNTFHAQHNDEYPECDYCGCLLATDLTGDGSTYPDGRHVCGLCLRSAVGDLDDAKNLMSEVMTELDGRGIDIDEKKIPLELVDRDEMHRLAKGGPSDPLGYTMFKKTTALGGLVSDEDFRIYILDGLPRAEFIFAIAHELMHVWLFKNAPMDLDATLCEGSCDYAGTLAVLASEDDEAARVWLKAMENPDPLYGEGLRKVDRYVKGAGVGTWLKYLRDHADPPW